MNFFCLSLLVFFSLPAFGAQLTWDFSTRTELDELALTSDELVYNQALGVLHPTLYGVSGVDTRVMDVGDGRHGSFDPSTYAQFSDNGDISGNTIRLNTDDGEFFPLQVTNFILADTWRLEITGSNGLQILSQTDVTIDGLIICNGENGSNGNLTTVGVGGRGRCGGGRGGDGGVPGLAGQNGSDVPGIVSPGIGGGVAGGGEPTGGGGGGSWNETPDSEPGTGAPATDGDAGQSESDPDFSTLSPGAGGGGGAGFGLNDAGGGGGGGGGLVVVNAARDLNIGINGEIRAWGGDGGNSSGNAGGGGGGAGGSVLMLVGRDITSLNPSFNTSDTDFGSRGTGGAGDHGGNGGIGRNWFTSARNFNMAGGYFPTEEFPFAPGVVEFESSTQRAVSASFDLRNTKTVFNSLSFSPQSTDFQVEMAGSDDDFQSDDTGWVTDLTLLEGKRYVRFRASITATNISEPDMMTSVTLDYTPGDKSEFDFKAVGCAMVGPVKPPRPSAGLFLLLPLAFLFLPVKICNR